MTTAAASTTKKPIFDKPIPIIGVTGEFESGKTRFALSLCPGPETLIYDTECSSEAYEEIGARRIDVPAEMLKRLPNGFKPIDTFQWWYSNVLSIPPGKFRVIALDVAEDIEGGLADWVWENPLQFNHTRAQYLKMSGLYWGDVKAYWKSILLNIRSRCEIFVFSVHTAAVWGGDNKPIAGKTRPKGKSTLMELATLFLHIERPLRADGSKPEVPSARVLKSRLSHNKIVNGSLVTKSILPPNLPQATPEAIRAYIARPADYSNLDVKELAVPVELSADDRAAIKLATAQAEADTERLRLERAIEERKSATPHGAEVDTSHGDDDLHNDQHVAPVQAVEPEPAPPTESATESATGSTAVSDSAAPAKRSRAKLPKGSIVEWLTAQAGPVRVETLYAAMHELHGVDSAKVYDAGKKLRDAGEVAVVQLGEAAFIGLPKADFSKVTAAAEPSQTPPPPPPSAATPPYVRPASLPAGLADGVRHLWEEWAIVCCQLPRQEADAIWSGKVLAKYGAISGNELTAADLADIEQTLVGKINNHYAERGTPEASPFRTNQPASTV
ncbi:MAG TPA: AAA family ATPase [Gemmataceae bacterium]|nr:AAA family ATPase [Gemmataceae bacterium]